MLSNSGLGYLSLLMLRLTRISPLLPLAPLFALLVIVYFWIRWGVDETKELLETQKIYPLQVNVGLIVKNEAEIIPSVNENHRQESEHLLISSENWSRVPELVLGEEKCRFELAQSQRPMMTIGLKSSFQNQEISFDKRHESSDEEEDNNDNRDDVNSSHSSNEWSINGQSRDSNGSFDSEHSSLDSLRRQSQSQSRQVDAKGEEAEGGGG
jgi:hypothetical protein